MSILRMILRSLLHHRRMHAAVGIGVVAGTAVLTGALLVGDSMRGSLRRLTLDRLGAVDHVLATDRFFRAELAGELAAHPLFSKYFTAAVPAILLDAGAEKPQQTARMRTKPPEKPPAQESGRAGRIHLLGCDERFWNLGDRPLPAVPTGRQVVLNRWLADKLNAEVDDRILLRLPRPDAVPAESSLGRKTETVETIPVTVGAIVPATGLGGFSLRTNQQSPLNAYVPLDWLASRLDQKGRVNAILVAGHDAQAPPPEAEAALRRMFRPRLVDYGIRVEETSRGYLNITSDRLILNPAVEKVVLASLSKRTVRPVFTYLANAIENGERRTPYSTIAAMGFANQPPLGPLVTSEGEPIATPAENEVVLNSWAAEDLKAKPGDQVTIRWFEPETRDGAVREQSGRFRVAAIAALQGPAADPALTPEVPGVTDQTEMSQWNPPFPFDASRIRPKDEQYWEQHRATPKALVSLATGRKLWQSRFGRTTSLQVSAADGINAATLKQQLDLDPAALGFVFQPVKRLGLEASAGATPFNVLFLMFSFFTIFAAVMLVALLFRLGIDQRSAEIGTLLAVGFRSRRIAGVLSAEGLAIAAVASFVGMVAGVGYAALMLAGLRTWWIDAVVVPFLRLYVTPLSLAIGYLSGVAVSAGAIVWAVRQARRAPVARLLAGRAGVERGLAPPPSRWLTGTAATLLIVAVAVGGIAGRMGEDARAGAFFGAGALVLAASLMFAWMRFRSGATGPAVAPGRGNLLRLAVRNAARHPGRSTLSIGLVASACFLIIAISAFHLDPIGRVPELASGDGGFALVGEAVQPVYQELNAAEGRAELGVPPDDDALLESAHIVPLRVRPGDDASCLNLYKPRQPRMLGVPSAMIARGGFDWAATAADSSEERANPWLLLNRNLDSDEDDTPRIPVVIEKNTALYALHLWNGVGERFDLTDGRGRKLRLVVVGLLNNGIFQGDLLVSEKVLLDYFPETSGYRFFLVEAQPEQTPQVGAALERALANYGFTAETTGQRLARFLAVQNTYLSTFRSLGGLGLLLGTFGLAAVELRNVLERRGELALLRATGFRRPTLAGLVMLENALLLVGGLGIGTFAALVALLPHLFSGSAGIPWVSLAGTVLLILLVGLVAGLIAVRAVLAAPMLPALRGE